MSTKNKKQFGVWMDSHHAIIVGKENIEDEAFVALGTVDNPGSAGNSNENASNNTETNRTPLDRCALPERERAEEFAAVIIFKGRWK